MAGWNNNMKNHYTKIQTGCIIVSVLFILFFSFLYAPSVSYLTPSPAQAAETKEIPAKGMITLVDLGAKKCVPCKMMAPILEKLEKAYQGKALIHFYDVWENREPAARFGIRAIPTQIFFDKDAKEVYRHEGFMSEEDIVGQLAKMGVK